MNIVPQSVDGAPAEPPLEEQIGSAAVLVATAFRMKDMEGLMLLLRNLVAIVDQVDAAAH